MPNIIDVKSSEQYKKDYREYALYVERHRTTPEFRDGLKPVQRRIIYAAKFVSKADTRVKSANVIGDTMGRYHPHGDSSIKGALYTMTNWYQSKVPLFVGQGNFGNTYQNVPAAPRYTEVALSKFTQECIIGELSSFKEIVDWEPNYDSSREEPSFLPCKVPLLLINGCTGISVGDKVDLPSHNMNEVIDATIALIRNPKAKVILIPDHCQECEIVDTDWASICMKGYGKYKIRGRIDIETYNGVEKRYHGLDTLVIKSCPNLTFLESIIEKLEVLVKENKIIGIQDMEEQSSQNDMRFVIILKPGTDPNYLRNEIYRNTQMMQTGRVDLKVMDITDRENPTKRLTYKGYLQAWILFRKNTKLRFYEHSLQRDMTRLHVIEMYIMAIENQTISNEILNYIKKMKIVDDEALMEALIKKYNITDIQAKFFINCEVKKLSKGYYNKFKKEEVELKERIKQYSDIVLTEGAIEQVIIEELEYIKAKYGEPRKCKIIKESDVNGIPSGMFKVVITENNFIKKIGMNDSLVKLKNDTVKFVIEGDNSKNLLLFDEIGRVFCVPISKIPFADKTSNGIDIRLINKNITSRINTVVYQPIMEHYDKGFIVTLTKNGFIKRMTTTDFLSVPSSGIAYCKLDNDDKVISILLFNSNTDLIVYGNKKALKISVNDIPVLKRNSRGCISMSSKVQVEGMSVLTNAFKDVVVVTKNGYVNKIIPECLQKGRGKAGSNVIKLGKTDSIVSICGVNPSDALVVTTVNNESIRILVNDIPSASSISAGTKMIKGGDVMRVFREGN